MPVVERTFPNLISLGMEPQEHRKPQGEYEGDEVKYVIWDLNGTMRKSIREMAIHAAVVSHKYYPTYFTRARGFHHFMRMAGCSPREFIEDIDQSLWSVSGPHVAKSATDELEKRWDRVRGAPIWEAYMAIERFHNRGVTMAMTSNAREDDIKASIRSGTQSVAGKDYVSFFGEAIVGKDSKRTVLSFLQHAFLRRESSLAKGEPQLKVVAERLKIPYQDLLRSGYAIVDTVKDVKRFKEIGIRVAGFSDVANTRVQLLEAGAVPVVGNIEHFESFVNTTNFQAQARKLSTPPEDHRR